jgi:hypothetical protein
MRRSKIISGDDAIVTGIHSFVILNLFQDNEPRSHVILKQVQDDELWGEGVGSTPISGMTRLSLEFPQRKII